MKKIFFVAIVTVLFASCDKKSADADSGYGYIDLGITTEVITKAVQNVNSSDLVDWTATVTRSGEASPSYSGAASDLASTPLVSGKYAVAIYNYADDAAAEAANVKWGAARYTGEVEVSVSSGTTQNPTIECGKSQNNRFTVKFDDSFKAVCTDENGTVLDTYSLTTKDSRALVFDKTTEGKYAYYAASASVSYILRYTFKGVAKTVEGSFSMGGITGTQKNLVLQSTNNGTISITISYDDSFIDGEDEVLTIDALTGEQVEE